MSDTAAEGAEPEKGNAFFRMVKEVVIILVVALGLSFFLRTFVVQAFYVPSQSMENTLMPNDRILASKLNTRLGGVKRGEIVVFRDPGNWLSPDMKKKDGGLQGILEWIGVMPTSTGDDLVKRVIGVAGDKVRCCNAKGQIVLNGVGLVEPYIKPGDSTDDIRFNITVPPDSVFVMGDNRNASADSRFHLDQNSGAVPVGNVVGRVVLTVWPFDQFGTHPIPAVPFDNPDLNASGQ